MSATILISTDQSAMCGLWRLPTMPNSLQKRFEPADFLELTLRTPQQPNWLASDSRSAKKLLMFLPLTSYEVLLNYFLGQLPNAFTTDNTIATFCSLATKLGLTPGETIQALASIVIGQN